MALLNSSKAIGKLPLMNLIRLKGTPILEQLHLEEKLLRASEENWCVVNDGTEDGNGGTIVMGVSGKPSELLDVKLVLEDQVPVVRRFTGGGTVIVDCGTIFVTIICNHDDVPGIQPYPRSVMTWSSLLYNKVFQGKYDFHLRENDYVFGDRKFGGNAESIIKRRWLHHTSFLWDYKAENMTYLQQPARAPKYRSARRHEDFVCRMKDYLPRSDFIHKTIASLGSHFSVRPIELEAIETSPGATFAPRSKLLTSEELKATIKYKPEILQEAGMEG